MRTRPDEGSGHGGCSAAVWSAEKAYGAVLADDGFKNRGFASALASTVCQGRAREHRQRLQTRMRYALPESTDSVLGVVQWCEW